MLEEYHVGFTGTQQGMTLFQQLCVTATLWEIRDTIRRHNPDALLWFHHGDCIGADFEAHCVALMLGFRVYVHPPTNPEKRAFSPSYSEIALDKPYLKRNDDIVAASREMIATPGGEEVQRSGTWATIRYAKTKDWVTELGLRPITIIYPSQSRKPTPIEKWVKSE